MIEPVAFGDISLAAIAGAAVIMFGALYALLFAWSRLHARDGFMKAAYAAYLFLFLAVLVLAQTLNLGGYWKILVLLMVIGYLLAPHLIWHLCVGTHGARHSAGELGDGQSTPGRSRQ